MLNEKRRIDCCRNSASHRRDLGNLQRFLKIISDKNRLRIICALGCGERCVYEIHEHLELAQNLTSHHLKFLENNNLVSCKKVGVKVFYKLNKKELEKNLELLSKFLKV